MSQRSTADGFTLLEAVIAVVLIGIFAGFSGWLLGDTLAESRAKAAVRSLADLMMLGRTEAIRTGQNHIVFFAQDAQGNPLTGAGGQSAAALLVRDADGDGVVDTGERVASINLDATGSLSWGSAYAANLSTPEQAPNDNAGADFPESDPDFVCCTFTTPGGEPASWVVFFPDGMPRSYELGPFAVGDVASGNGGVYVTTGSRDYAVVLAPLGGVRTHIFQRGADDWTR
jgi:prepilin-type N-terminal cleavage/methylation domain-containing protein